MPTAKFIVSGRVQGVFYRASTREQASTLSLDGYAKNLPDGRVEVLVSGSPEALDTLERWLRCGPAGACVESVTRKDVAAQDLRGFHIA